MQKDSEKNRTNDDNSRLVEEHQRKVSALPSGAETLKSEEVLRVRPLTGIKRPQTHDSWRSVDG